MALAWPPIYTRPILWLLHFPHIYQTNIVTLQWPPCIPDTIQDRYCGPDMVCHLYQIDTVSLAWPPHRYKTDTMTLAWPLSIPEQDCGPGMASIYTRLILWSWDGFNIYQTNTVALGWPPYIPDQYYGPGIAQIYTIPIMWHGPPSRPDRYCGPGKALIYTRDKL